jgi:hypothetical protein
MSRTIKLMIFVGAVILVAVLFYSTAQEGKYKYKVCVSFHGSSRCTTASGQSPDQAIRAAQGVICSGISNGRDEVIACEATSPTSVEQLTGN